MIAVPCNQFAEEEPGTPQEITDFVSQFGVQFPLLEKQDVNGDNASELYKALKTGGGSGDITWNFAKFLVDGQG